MLIEGQSRLTHCHPAIKADAGCLELLVCLLMQPAQLACGLQAMLSNTVSTMHQLALPLGQQGGSRISLYHLRLHCDASGCTGVALPS